LRLQTVLAAQGAAGAKSAQLAARLLAQVASAALKPSFAL
jgi:hypothetical protein